MLTIVFSGILGAALTFAAWAPYGIIAALLAALLGGNIAGLIAGLTIAAMNPE
jgi:hypothetical protein